MANSNDTNTEMYIDPNSVISPQQLLHDGDLEVVVPAGDVTPHGMPLNGQDALWEAVREAGNSGILERPERVGPNGEYMQITTKPIQEPVIDPETGLTTGYRGFDQYSENGQAFCKLREALGDFDFANGGAGIIFNQDDGIKPSNDYDTADEICSPGHTPYVLQDKNGVILE